MTVCPVCGADDCLFWQLHDAGSWHPVPLDRQEGIPAEYLRPVWRATPSRTGVATVGLDPREAVYVLANGLTIDGERWRVSLEGCSGEVQRDGRIQVRITLVDQPEFVYEAVTR